MRKLFSIIILGLVLSSCSNFKPYQAFDKMSLEELAIYNSGVSLGQQVYCFEEVRTGSFRKRRFCATRFELTDSLANSAGRLWVLDSNSEATPGRAIYSFQ